ncbi:DotD/TraH family lipoprotein [Serratia ureilytica]|uniref:DotD/TraH family lipoprotein n=1 Tax=Serratia ureilytica TaxID=300181 RepID=UPI001AA14B8D|nr:DotD/TraH family lipoprotein [Serratia ureilytica]MBO1811524.1 DotD/TraH family lipoprotein [Serratia ureilytica]
MHFRLSAACAATLLLSACQTPATPSHTPVESASTPRIVSQQQVLWQEGAINQRTPSFIKVSGIRANSDRVYVQWDGDAVELLSHLARQRGLAFVWTGVRLPLPVSVDVNGITYQNLLRLIELQTAWRATLHEYPGQLTLAFAQPEAHKKGRVR